jgi:hypothetical protein
MTTLIGINGFKRSGKGEVGNAIADVGYDRMRTTHQLGFADKLKILAAKSLGFLDRSDTECIALMDEAKEEWVFNIKKLMRPEDGWPTGVWHDLTGREYLQNMGNEARTVFGEDFWVDQVLDRPSRRGQEINTRNLEQRYSADYVAFTDLRYPNEAKRVLDLGGEVWEVVRPGVVSDGHASERRLPQMLVSRIIINDGTLMDLRYRVEKALGV